ncbi:putative BSD domain-containing protein 1 [Apostichopus japonicus]|uniref:Putative BSD domain-containing protein 1 n=1 Tax=Stichopus japonicus TaxID=307972 RepID=A0A2G8KAL2_STIJA|nr:putative BSD domain-containing protein 1 [Apostichopus japonicus]
MAAGGSDPSESWWSSESSEWFGSILTAAKEKSSAALQQMSKDIQEFGTTIQKDTTQAVATSASKIGQNLKPEDEEEDVKEDKSTTEHLRDGFLSFLTNVSKTLATPENVTGEEYIVHPRDSHVFDQTKARFHAMQVDPATYCNEPDDPLDDYQNWLESFNVEDMKGDISELLVANSQVRSIYTKLVPAAVSHGEFWSRYFYKVHLLDQDEARRNALKERAEMTSSQHLEEDLGWGDEDESWDTVPEVRKDTTATSAGLDSKETPKADVDPPQEDKKETLNVKETPNRTQSETDVDTNNKTDVIVDNSVKSSSQSTSQASLKEEEEVTVTEVAETDLIDGVKELTLEPEENIQEERKEDRSPTESSNGSSGNKGKPNPPPPPTSFTPIPFAGIKNLEWIAVLKKVNLS